ncbi:MAG: cbb3-type cytochrome c oxidase subunit II [Chthoniobacteraceae bacterium]
MSRSSYLFAGIFGSFAISCFTLVLVPQMQIGGVTEHVNEDEGTRYPVWNSRPGREVYIREGCYYCHTQQVRDVQNGSDMERGWGTRRTVARDYMFENPPLLGSIRIGPDLTNAGAKGWRNEPATDTSKPNRRDRMWQLVHLYDPRVIVPASTMPPYRYLFTEVKRGGQPAENALPIAASREGYEIVPTAEAVQLADYILSLDRTSPLPEAGALKSAAPAATSAPAPAPAAVEKK